MTVIVPPTGAPEVIDTEVLFPEARRFQRRRCLFWIVTSVLVVAVSVTLATVLTNGPARKIPSSRGPVASHSLITQFLRAAERADETEFTATYRVTGTNSIFFYNGSYSVSRIPSPAGAKPIVNGEVTFARAQYGYLVHEANGDVIQWIENGATVSTCLRLSGKLNADVNPMKCSGPFASIASNGFSEEKVPFVPNTSIQQIGSMEGYPSHPSYFTSQSSAKFGALRCLHQFYSTESLVTCEDPRGFLVSSVWRNRHPDDGHRIATSNARLQSFSHRADMKILTTLLKPTKGLELLPPF